MPVSGLGVEDGADVEALDEAAPGEIEAAGHRSRSPAFTRRTLTWLSTSLLEGNVARDDRVIF